jgi:hypothetical protein
MDNSSSESIPLVPIVLVIVVFILVIAGGLGFYVIRNTQETAARDLRSSSQFSVNKERVIVDAGKTGSAGGSAENLPSKTPVPTRPPVGGIIKGVITEAPLYPTRATSINAGSAAESILYNKTVSSWKIEFPKNSYSIDKNLVAVTYDMLEEKDDVPKYFLPYIEGTLKAPVSQNTVVCVDYEESFFTYYSGSKTLEKLCDSINKPVEPFPVMCEKYSKDGLPLGEVVYQRGGETCDKLREAVEGEYILRAKVGYNCDASEIGNATKESLNTCKYSKELYSEPVMLTK